MKFMKHAVNRYIVAFILAPIVTLLLLWGMQTLIAGGNDAFSEAPKGRVLDFVRLKKEEAPKQKERKPQKPPKPQTPPPPMQQPQMAQSNPNADAISTDFSADIQADTSLSGGTGLSSSDGEYLPIVKGAAIYPRRAQSRGIEGKVVIEFTVSKTGAVTNPVVISATPKNIFEQACINAASKWKYKPRVVDGVAMEVAGVKNQCTFEIE